VPVPVSPVLTDAEIRFIAADCATGFVHLDASRVKQAAMEAEFAALPMITGDEVRQAFPGDGKALPGTETGAPPAEWSADSEALLQYTSGSTGTPKGVLHSPAGIDAVLTGFGSLLELAPADVVLSTAKMSFGYGFGNSVLFPLAAGARTVLLRGTVDAHVLATALRRHQPTVLFSVPRMYASLLRIARRHDAARWAALRLAVQLADTVRDVLGVPVLNGLGATEVLHIVVATRPTRPPTGSTGFAVPGITVTVQDENGRPVPDGDSGRLHITGPSVALGYLNRPEETSRTFTAGGAFTNDVVRRGEDGDIRYVCRTDDLLNLGGYKVDPGDIERVVRATDGVADCAVVATTDKDGLDQAVAYAVPLAAADPAQVRRAILAAIRGNLAPFKRPAGVEVLDTLPITSTGKLARYQLRSLADHR
jgi:acyl-coenzyme A synthetase/AMP-(fatty) acid ligase